MHPPGRAGLALVLVGLQAPAALGPARAITEADALRLFLQTSPQARRVLLEAESMRAEESLGSEAPNPVVAYQIEDAAGARDEFLTLQQELPIAGRRSLIRDRAAAAAEASTLAGERDLQIAAYALKGAFYDLVYRNRVVEVLRPGREGLARTVEMLRAREREGEGSGYDVLRAEQEMDELDLELGQAEGASAASRARFASFFGEGTAPGSAWVEGDFSLESLPSTAEDAGATALQERSDLRAIRAEALREDLDLRAARRRRLPEPTLAAGWKRVEAMGSSDTGFVASVSVPLPIFDRGQLAARRARYGLDQVEVRRQILEREIRAEVEAALARARAAREAAERFGGEVEPRAGELRRIALLAYEEGEMGILELLDALRSSLRLQLQALAARHEAKQGEIELHRAIGREVRP